MQAKILIFVKKEKMAILSFHNANSWKLSIATPPADVSEDIYFSQLTIGRNYLVISKDYLAIR